MPQTVYFDTNVFFDVFEDRIPELFPVLRDLVSAGRVEVIVSEINLTEVLAGNHRTSFSGGVGRLLATSPRWLYLSGMAAREVADAYDGPAKPQVLTPPGTFIDWATLLPWIVDDTQGMTAGIDLPTADALLQVYPEGSIGERIKFWKNELQAMQTELREILQFVGTAQNVFRKLVASTLRRNLGSTRDFADHLWDNPDLVPAFRLDVELNCQTLNVINPRWTTNDFMDHIHAGALGYVDLFVTRDGLGNDSGLIQKIEWYDAHVRTPRGATSYATKLCRGWNEFVTRF